jgi:serine/threonine protein kinase
VQCFARKVIRPFGSSISSKDIENEVRAMDLLCQYGHENIIRVLRHGLLRPIQAFYFIDMEVCDLNLEEYLKNIKTGVRGLIEWPTAICEGHGPFLVCAIMQQIIRGLAFIHSNGEAHRDLNPQNGLYKHPNQTLM